MKQPLALLGLGLLLLMVQGAVGLVVPARFLPDLGLVLVVAIALSLRNPAVGVTLATVAPFPVSSITLVVIVPLIRFGAANVVGKPTNAEKICVVVVVLVTRMLLSTNGSGLYLSRSTVTSARPPSTSV